MCFNGGGTTTKRTPSAGLSLINGTIDLKMSKLGENQGPCTEFT